MEVIRLENATKIYRIGEVQTRALDGVSLSIEDGEFTALVGPSGSGKTTLLQLMGCLDRPDSGVVWIDGQDATRLNANQRADLRRVKIGFIFQFFALIPVLSAYENVELPLLLSGVGAKERRTHASWSCCTPSGWTIAPPSPRPTERRRAAARGHRPRPGAAPFVDPGRRADGQPGHRQRGTGHGDHAAPQRADGHGLRLRHPRPTRDGVCPPGRQAPRRADRRRRRRELRRRQ